MDPISLPWGEFMCLSEQYQGIVFLNLGDESVPHFIIDLVMELKREKIVTDISPCEIFERSYLIDIAGCQKDLALLLKNIGSDMLDRFNH